MLRLLTQPQRELQLYLKTNNNQNCQEIRLYGSPTTKDKKKPHSSRWVREAESQRLAERYGDAMWYGKAAVERVVTHSHVVDKIQEGYLGSKQSQPRSHCTAQGSSARKIDPHNFWL